MDEIVIEGGRRLEGEVMVSGSKNATLPLLFSTLLTAERCVLRNVPALADIRTAQDVLRHLGAQVSVGPGGHEVVVEARALVSTEASYDLVKTMRRLVPRAGAAARPLRARACLHAGRMRDRGAPGRPNHLAGLEKMGAQIHIR